MTTAAKASGSRARAGNGAQSNGHPEAATSLLAALHAVQQEAPTLPKDKTNPHFKSNYTPLDTIVEKIGPLLSEHGLVWTALPCRDEQGEPALRYRLAHVATGEELEGVMPLMLGKSDSQGMGAAITYARRYSLCAVLNLVADDDDDGERTREKGEAATPAVQTIDAARVAGLMEAFLALPRPDEKADEALKKELKLKLGSIGVSATGIGAAFAKLTPGQADEIDTWVADQNGGAE